MTNPPNPRSKFYECLDATIYYQIASHQIAFLIDEKVTSKIARWERETAYSSGEMELLMWSADGTPSYHLKFFVVKDKVNLIVLRPLNYILQSCFRGQESQDLIYLDSMICPQMITKPELVVLKIDGEAYQALVNWKSWIYEEAFSGRYIYGFYENVTFTQRLVTIQDIETGEILEVDDSDRLWSI